MAGDLEKRVRRKEQRRVAARCYNKIDILKTEREHRTEAASERLYLMFHG